MCQAVTGAKGLDGLYQVIKFVGKPIDTSEILINPSLGHKTLNTHKHTVLLLSAQKYGCNHSKIKSCFKKVCSFRHRSIN